MLTHNEAFEMLKECREAGLVHMTHNTTDQDGYLGTCDKYHCYAIKMILQQPAPSAVFNSGFEPRFNPDSCIACETCLDRCPAVALKMSDQDVPKVDLNLCFGCAVCATGCADETITMVSKAEGYEPPPKDNNELMQKMITAFSEK